MSDEGVSDDLGENSGEIKRSTTGDIVSIDNCNSVNSYFITMGHSVEELDNEEGSVSCKQDETIIGDSALIFKDIKSVREWLENKTDLIPSVDFDATKNYNLLNSNSDEIVRNESENASIVLPQITNFSNVSIQEPNISVENWEDFVLEPQCIINENDFSNYIQSVPETDVNSSSKLNENHSFDGFLSAPSVSISSTQTKSSPSKGNHLIFSGKSMQPEKKLNNVCMSMPTQIIFKQLPLVKIPKNCLIKGKILGKSHISTFSSKSSLSLLHSSTQKIKPTLAVNPTTQPSVKVPQHKPKHQPISLTSKSVNLDGKQSIVVLPMKSNRNISSNSLLKVNQKHSLLKVNNKPNTTTQLKSVLNKTIRPISFNPKVPKKAEPVAVVAISTDKSVNTTEIVIKTEEGENVYKGKTSDIMEATGSLNMQTSTAPNKSDIDFKKRNENKAVNDILENLLGRNYQVLDSISSMTIQCPFEGCQFSCFKGKALKAHILQHYCIRPFKCDYPNCTWAFYTSFRLKRHQEVHYKKKEFKCPVEGCDRKFSTIYNIRPHLKLHWRPNSITCSIDGCNKAFQTRKGYDKHLEEHGPEHAPYTCNKEGCGRKYFTINSLNSHSRIHQHEEEELTCCYCGKNFKAPCRLKAHLNIHMGVRPYKCEFEGCMWAFSTSSKLCRHQRKHTQARRHSCKVCGKSFLRADHLKDHSIKHFVKKSFICPIADCGTVFSNKSTMYTHLKKHRNQETTAEVQSYPCPMDDCNLAFITKENLRTHLQISHPNITSEHSQDAIQLLSDDQLLTLETLQSTTSNSGSGVVSFNSMSQDGLLVGMSDLVQCIPAMEQGEYSESSNSNNIITHVVFTDDTALEPSLADMEEGSSVTYQTTDGQLEGTQPRDSLPSSHHMASDVVLSAGLLASHDNLERSLLLQDELSGADLYSLGQEESGLAELQVLLLDPATRLQPSELEQSTINLRDLE